MLVITLNLNDDAAANYARFKGYEPTKRVTNDNGTESVVDNDQSAEDFIAQALFGVVQNDLIEQRNRDAVTEAASQPAPIVSPDQIIDDTIVDATNSQEMEDETNAAE